jgi:hypothetical protein
MSLHRATNPHLHGQMSKSTQGSNPPLRFEGGFQLASLSVSAGERLAAGHVEWLNSHARP